MMSELETFIRKNIDFNDDQPFYIFNVEDVIRKHTTWKQCLPRVVPYYAVKANPSPVLLNVLVALGLKFDCASQVCPSITIHLLMDW